MPGSGEVSKMRGRKEWVNVSIAIRAWPAKICRRKRPPFNTQCFCAWVPARAAGVAAHLFTQQIRRCFSIFESTSNNRRAKCQRSRRRSYQHCNGVVRATCYDGRHRRTISAPASNDKVSATATATLSRMPSGREVKVGGGESRAGEI